MENKEDTCTNYCFFLRDIDATNYEKDDKGLKILLFFWIEKTNKDVVKEWLYNYNDNTSNIRNKLDKLVQIFNLL
jgi:hypothetical protein